MVVPPELPTRAGVDTTNGVGELTAKLEIDEYGLMITPVWLCGTHAVGTVYDAAVLAAGGSPKKTVIPVVGECDDSDLADSRTVTVEDAHAALANAGTDVAEGTVGSGTGMTCFDFAGGIGTSSRLVEGYTVGVLLMCNFGDRERLTIGGLRFDPVPGDPPPEGSCIAVCATDAPLTAIQLRRMALRPLLGLAWLVCEQRVGRDRDRVRRHPRAGVPDRPHVAAPSRRLRGRRGVGLQLPGGCQAGHASGRPPARGLPEASGQAVTLLELLRPHATGPRLDPFDRGGMDRAGTGGPQARRMITRHSDRIGSEE